MTDKVFDATVNVLLFLGRTFRLTYNTANIIV